jgi:chloride channel 7
LEGNILDGALEMDISVKQLFVFWFVWYLFFCTTYGTNIPSGLFSPGIVMGMAIGQIYYQMLTQEDWYGATVDPGLKRKFMSIGPAAIISGYVRMKYCVAIIILEICEDFTLFVPMFIAVLVSNHVGDQFTRGVYHRLVRTKQCPILNNCIPLACQKLKADYIMNPNLKCFHSVEKVSTIAKFLKDTRKQHRAFPIWNEEHHLVGIIPRNFLIVMLRYKNWYYENGSDYKNVLEKSEHDQLTSWRKLNDATLS